MNNDEEVQALKLALIREYDTLAPGVAVLAGVSRPDAQEALHTAICRLLVGVTRRPQGNPVLGWRPYIIRTAINVLKEEARRVARRRQTVLLFSELSPQQRRELFELQAPQPGPAEMAEKRELAARAWEEMGKLPPRQREVIARRCFGQSFREIGAVMDVSVGTATKLYSIGIDELRRRLLAPPSAALMGSDIPGRSKREVA